MRCDSVKVQRNCRGFYGIKKSIHTANPIGRNGGGRPNAIKWQAGRSISAGNGGHGRQRPQGKTDGVKTDGVAGAAVGDDEGNISEIRATEFIRKGEEIT